MNSQGKILLTGATGFIGSHVLEALTDAGLPVRVLVRPNADLSQVKALGADIACGDIRDPLNLRKGVHGCSQVIHIAGLARDWGKRAEFFDTNLTGTMNVLQACHLESVPKVIITGSISSYGEEDSTCIKDESSPFRSHYPYFLDGLFPSAFNGYRDSKAAATQQAIAFARHHHLNLIVLEPAWVFGEREFGTGFYAYVKAVQTGQKYMPGSNRNRFHVIYAKDLARAYLLASQKHLPGTERFIIGAENAELMRRVFGLFCQEAGLPGPRLLPKWSAYPVGFALELAWTLARRRQPPFLTRSRVNMFYDSIGYSTAKARRLLRFQCEYTLEQGIRQTVAWYKTNHHL